MKDYYKDYKEFETEGIKYIRLDMCCPNHEAYRAGRGPQYWQHKNCGGDIYLGDNATFFCSRDGFSFFWKSAKFECPLCSTSSEGFLISNSGMPNITRANLLSCINKENIKLDFLIKFIQALRVQQEESETDNP